MYAVKLDNSMGCKNTSVCFNFVNSSSKDHDLDNQITIYPNPTNNYFQFLIKLHMCYRRLKQSIAKVK